MTTAVVVFCIYLCLPAIAMAAIPNMTRRGILFGLSVPPEFRATSAARAAIARYRIVIGIALAACLAAALLAPRGPVAVGGPLAILAAGELAFLWQRRKLRAYAVESEHPREVELTTTPDRLPRFVWLNIGPFLILLAAALVLNAHQADIPARFPVHWGFDGRPNRWSSRTLRGIYGPVIFGSEICAWILITALATWFGARRSRLRRATLAALTIVEFLVACEFALIAMMPLGYLGAPGPAIVVAPLVFVIPVLILMFRAVREPGASPEPTPDECWKGGMIYYNPDDPALFAEKRAGAGYTFNFGNRWSWLLALGLAAIAGTAPLVL